jgi:O-antigen/teichoic acid export membrane protein
MIKKSLVKVGLVGTGNMLNAVLGFAFLTALAQTLDLESFGKYALLASLLIFLSRLLDFGTNSTFVAQYLVDGKTSLKKDFYASKIILAVIALPIALAILVYLKLATLQISLAFVGGLLAYGINYTLFAFFQKTEKYFSLVMLNTLPAILKGAFSVAIFTGVFTPTYTTAFYVFSLTVFSSALLWIFIPEEFKKVEFSLTQVKNLFKKSSPAGISQLITEGWPAFNNTIAKLASGFADVGIFSLADKLSNIFALASVSVFTVLLPKNATRAREKKGYDFKETGILAVGIMLLAVIATFVARFLIAIFLGDKFSGSMQVLNILIFAAAFTAIHSFMENYFFVQQKPQHILYINSSKLIAFVVLGLTLVSYLGLRGLAWANLLSAIIALGISLSLILRNNQSAQK